MSRFPLPGDEDNRTIKEWMRDQGLDVIDTNPKRERKPPKWGVSVSRTSLTFTAKAIEIIGSTKLHLGVRRLEGQPVLLIKPAGYFDLRCLELRPAPSGTSYYLPNPVLCGDIQEAGLKPGRYELCKAKGGFIATPL